MSRADPMTTKVLWVSHTHHLQRSLNKADPGFTYPLTSQTSVKHFFCIVKSSKVVWLLFNFFLLFFINLFIDSD